MSICFSKFSNLVKTCKGKIKMIGITGYPFEPLNEIIEKSTVQVDMVLSYARGCLG